ncbi:ABC transporter ATP-binding protein [candidate division KSB3 bacterium]|uniref:ABC transporter ATP-binding protein n=1 Tax=candidate division KSB3 bacterium TaxID=2044937 RepID=A0A2G6E6L5_9BACT|nr:MAG: ABC transporter ATP-binding protein [candidate division KSB3 bacterium]PIE30142.1 MAG: ABC transporter ATP-binding protein [candidate division KSB3 bacterium]
MLEVKNVSFRYHRSQPWILHNVDVTIRPGEIVGLQGHSGRGKTTLARILSGYLTPSAGSVLLDEQPLPCKGFMPVQLLFQHPEQAVNPRWTAQKILTEGHRPPAELLEMLSIDSSWLDRFPHELSGGELQRLAVARALGPQTRYIIADEMTSMLDANTQAQLWQALLEYVRSRRIGILTIAHDRALLERLVHRIAPIFDAA